MLNSVLKSAEASASRAHTLNNPIGAHALLYLDAARVEVGSMPQSTARQQQADMPARDLNSSSVMDKDPLQS